MKDLLLRLRGAIGIGASWGIVWAILGAALVAGIGALRPGDVEAGEGPVTGAIVLGAAGFLSGLAFATLLSVAERRRTIAELPLGRTAVLGFAGASAIPLAMGTDGSMWAMTGALGAAFAAGSVALARRRTRPPAASPELLER